MAKGLILLADGDLAFTEPVRTRLEAAGYEVVVVTDGAAALAELHRVELDVALVELALPGRGGLDVLAAAHHLSPETEVVILDDRAELATANACIRRGAFDLLAKPLDLDGLVLTVSRAIERRSLRATTTLFRASQEILRVQDPAKLAATIVELAARVLEADDVALALIGPDGRMTTRHSHSFSEEARALGAAEVGDALATRVAELGEPVLLPDEAGKARLPEVALVRVRSCIIFPLRSGDRRVGVLTLSRISDHRPYRQVDVERTGILASQALLATENAALTHRMVEAERLATIGNLAAGVAHEINNPLSYVLTSAEYARDKLSMLALRIKNMAPELASRLAPTVRDMEEALSDVGDGAQRIKAIARDLRGLARAESPVREIVDLSQIVRSAQRLTAARLRGKATVHLDLPTDTLVRGDEGRLVQIFVNLLVNALQAGEGDGVVTIRIATRRVDDQIVTTVHDDGPGIAPEDIRRIFQPFFSTKTAGNGTGLGLSLSQSIAVEHGGTLKVESVLGNGATFVLSLPVSEAACAGAPDGSPSSYEPRSTSAPPSPSTSAPPPPSTT